MGKVKYKGNNFSFLINKKRNSGRRQGNLANKKVRERYCIERCRK